MNVRLFIADLEYVMAEGRPFLYDQVFIDEERFFNSTAKLKQAMANESKLSQFERAERAAHRQSNSFRLVDELEQLVENGSVHFFDRVLIHKPKYSALVQELEVALVTDMKQSAQIIDSHASNAERILAQAHAEAEHIIESARFEAERILAKAKQQKGFK